MLSELSTFVRYAATLPGYLRHPVSNHQQFPKTHLGISPQPQTPTVSLSGSHGAVAIAHELRKVHATDPIAPFYHAMLGTDPPSVLRAGDA